MLRSQCWQAHPGGVGTAPTAALPHPGVSPVLCRSSIPSSNGHPSPVRVARHLFAPPLSRRQPYGKGDGAATLNVVTRLATQEQLAVRAAGQLHVVVAGGAYTSLPLSIPNSTRITVIRSLHDHALAHRQPCCLPHLPVASLELAGSLYRAASGGCVARVIPTTSLAYTSVPL